MPPAAHNVVDMQSLVQPVIKKHAKAVSHCLQWECQRLTLFCGAVRGLLAMPGGAHGYMRECEREMAALPVPQQVCAQVPPCPQEQFLHQLEISVTKKCVNDSIDMVILAGIGYLASNMSFSRPVCHQFPAKVLDKSDRQAPGRKAYCLEEKLRVLSSQRCSMVQPVLSRNISSA